MDYNKIDGYTRLAVSLRIGEEYWVGPIRATYYAHQYNLARLTVEAPPSVPIWRGDNFARAVTPDADRALALAGPFYIERQVGEAWERVLPELYRTVEKAEITANRYRQSGHVFRVVSLFTGRPAALIRR